MEQKTFHTVNTPVRKKDAMQLLLGKPAYVEDVTPRDCLVVKLLRSPHAHALIEYIRTDVAMKVPGIECIFTYKDVPNNRFTNAGQTYPEPSPYDRLILDRRVRYVGDPVAIVAGADEACVDRALKLIKVKYQVLEPVLDFLRELETLGDLQGDMLGILLKAVGIGLVSEIAGLVCTDAGNGSLGKTLQMLGSAVILYLSLPIFTAMLELIREILREL